MVAKTVRFRNDQEIEAVMFSRLSNILSSFSSGSSSSDLPYNLENEEICAKYPWTVSRGSAKADGTPVTVLTFELKGRNEEEIQLARVGHTKLKTMRHPNILKYIDGVESGELIRIVTEDAVPLDVMLKDGQKGEFFVKYGILQLLRAIDFLSNKCGIVHGNVGVWSVYVDSASEWKLAGLEFSHSKSDSSHPTRPSSFSKYDPPETSRRGSDKASVSSADMWGLGVLIYELFNGEPLQHTSDLRITKKIPKPLVQHYCTLVSANPTSRPSPQALLEEMRAHGGYLNDTMISLAMAAEEVHVMEATQRKTFLEDLNKHIESFPKSFCTNKLLTCLLNTFEFSNVGTAILEPMFKIAQFLEDEEYQRKIVPCVVKLFSSTDRATRLQLLQKMSSYVEHIRTSTATNDIFPSVALGFTDTVQAIREETVKSIALLAPKLTPNILNNQLLKYLAKSQMDPVPCIRTNTTIVLSKVAPLLDESTRQRVLSSAFLRGLRDPFLPAKLASLQGLCATSRLYKHDDIANKIIPALSPLLIDPQKEVRDKVFPCLEGFLTILKVASTDMNTDSGQASTTNQQVREGGGAWTWMGGLSSFYKGNSEKGDKPLEPTLKTGLSVGQETHPSPDKENQPSPVTLQDNEPSLQVDVEQQSDAWEGDDTWESFELGNGDELDRESEKDKDGWGDWTEDLDVQKEMQSGPVESINTKKKDSGMKDQVPIVTVFNDSSSKVASSSGWKNDDGWSDDWADSFSSAGKSAPQSSSQSRDLDSRQLKQEERRKKQEAARQKRAASTAAKPKLGGKGD